MEISEDELVSQIMNGDVDEDESDAYYSEDQEIDHEEEVDVENDFFISIEELKPVAKNQTKKRTSTKHKWMPVKDHGNNTNQNSNAEVIETIQPKPSTTLKPKVTIFGIKNVVKPIEKPKLVPVEVKAIKEEGTSANDTNKQSELELQVKLLKDLLDDALSKIPTATKQEEIMTEDCHEATDDKQLEIIETQLIMKEKQQKVTEIQPKVTRLSQGRAILENCDETHKKTDNSKTQRDVTETQSHKKSKGIDKQQNGTKKTRRGAITENCDKTLEKTDVSKQTDVAETRSRNQSNGINKEPDITEKLAILKYLLTDSLAKKPNKSSPVSEMNENSETSMSSANTGVTAEKQNKVTETQTITEKLKDELLKDFFDSTPSNKPTGSSPKRKITDDSDETSINTHFIPEKQPKMTVNQLQVLENPPEITENLPKITENPPKITESVPEYFYYDETGKQPKVIIVEPKITENSFKNSKNVTCCEVTDKRLDLVENRPKIIEAQPILTENPPKITKNFNVKQLENLLESKQKSAEDFDETSSNTDLHKMPERPYKKTELGLRVYSGPATRTVINNKNIKKGLNITETQPILTENPREQTKNLKVGELLSPKQKITDKFIEISRNKDLERQPKISETRAKIADNNLKIINNRNTILYSEPPLTTGTVMADNNPDQPSIIKLKAGIPTKINYNQLKKITKISENYLAIAAPGMSETQVEQTILKNLISKPNIVLKNPVKLPAKLTKIIKKIPIKTTLRHKIYPNTNNTVLCTINTPSVNIIANEIVRIITTGNITTKSSLPVVLDATNSIQLDERIKPTDLNPKETIVGAEDTSDNEILGHTEIVDKDEQIKITDALESTAEVTIKEEVEMIDIKQDLIEITEVNETMGDAVQVVDIIDPLYIEQEHIEDPHKRQETKTDEVVKTKLNRIERAESKTPEKPAQSVNTGPKYCKICHKVFFSEVSMKNHKHIKYKCGCGEEFSSQIKLEEHKSKEHSSKSPTQIPSKPTPQKPIKKFCKKCKKVFCTTAALMNHKHVDIECCGNLFATLKLLEAHNKKKHLVIRSKNTDRAQNHGKGCDEVKSSADIAKIMKDSLLLDTQEVSTSKEKEIIKNTSTLDKQKVQTGKEVKKRRRPRKKRLDSPISVQCKLCKQHYPNLDALYLHINSAHDDGSQHMDKSIDELTASAYEHRLSIQKRRRILRQLRQECDPLVDLTEERFVKCYRLGKFAVRSLADDLLPLLPREKRKDSLSGILKILVALSFYATGSYQNNIGDSGLHNLSQASVSRAVRQVTAALNHPSIIKKYVRWPQTSRERNDVKGKFLEKFGIPGILGCIHGTHVAIIRPRTDEARYSCPKEYHSINVMIICDADMRILCVDPSGPGSSQDSAVWDSHSLSQELDDLYEDGEHSFLLGDSGYTLRRTLITPIANPTEGSPDHHFCTRHASARSTVERCIALLKARFRCLLVARALHYEPENAGKIVNACAVLHNLAVESNAPPPEELTPDEIAANIARMDVAEPAGAGVSNIDAGFLEGRALRQELVLQLWRNSHSL